MAFGRLERSQGSEPMSDINMTPLIDVMLVLLVIFMLTAPLMTSRLKLELPKVDAPATQAAEQPLSVAITADGQWHVGDEPVSQQSLREQAAARAKAQPDAEVQLRADKAVPYGQVAELIGALQAAGLQRIAFVTASDGAQLPAATRP